MTLGIDASNLREGGGLIHLSELLKVAQPVTYGFSRVTVWGGTDTLRAIEDRPWLVKIHQPRLDGSLLHRLFWQRFRLAALARAAGCDLLFAPGSSHLGGFRPLVAMSQNMLPFEWRELRRFGWSWTRLRYLLLRWSQSRTFREADGLVFLTRYARHSVMSAVKAIGGRTATIPHGIGERFRCPPRGQRPIGEYSSEKPFRILYVSIINLYKHQWCVAEAVALLRRQGLPVVLDLVGPAHPPAMVKLRETLTLVDPDGEFIRYRGDIPHGELPANYLWADLFVFASSCENLPIILLEAMAAGLPIACSRYEPMPEILGKAGVYFDPEMVTYIMNALSGLIDSPARRAELAEAAFERSHDYTWQRNADETFSFLAEVALAYRGGE